jgi:hypothetical protein
MLHKSAKNHGFELELYLVGSPLFVTLVWCQTSLHRYHLFDTFFITRSNFKLSAGKAPTVELSLGKYYPELKNDGKDGNVEGNADKTFNAAARFNYSPAVSSAADMMRVGSGDCGL